MIPYNKRQDAQIVKIKDYINGKREYVTGQGTEVTLENTIAAQFTKFDVEGNSVQDGTPSPDNEVPIYNAGDNENLFDKDNVDWFRNNNSSFIDITNNSPSRIRTSSFAIEGGETYTVSGMPQGIIFNTVRCYSEYGGNRTNEISSNPFTLPNTTKYIHLLFNGENLTDESITLMKNANIKLEQGTVATPYSPYGMGSINEYIRPKQLFNIKTVSNGYLDPNTGVVVPNTGWKTSDFIKIYKLIKITFSWVSNNSYFQVNMCYYDKNKNFISGVSQAGGDKYKHTFTVPENAYYCKLSYSVNVSETSVTREKIQLEEGTANTDYEEYKEPQTYTIPVQAPFRSIGDVRDCFVKKSDGWYERHYIKEFIADGDNFSCGYMFPSGWFNLFEKNMDNNYIEIRYCKKTANNVVGNVMCNKLIAETVAKMSRPWSKKGISLNVNGSIGMKFDDATEETNTWTKESINSYLAENPFTIQAELENPTDIPCTETQIQQLENIPSTYKDFTYVTSEDETPVIINAEAVKKLL